MPVAFSYGRANTAVLYTRRGSKHAVVVRTTHVAHAARWWEKDHLTIESANANNNGTQLPPSRQTRRRRRGHGGAAGGGTAAVAMRIPSRPRRLAAPTSVNRDDPQAAAVEWRVGFVCASTTGRDERRVHAVIIPLGSTRGPVWFFFTDTLSAVAERVSRLLLLPYLHGYRTVVVCYIYNFFFFYRADLRSINDNRTIRRGWIELNSPTVKSLWFFSQAAAAAPRGRNFA